MKVKKFEIELLPEDSADRRIEAYENVCRYLLQRYYGGCEEFECFGVFEGIDGGTGRKRLFHTGPEDRGCE
ncbi:MAG: hypothetical protein PHS15_06335 [Clostridiaceae bacterium]|nr:hypothetical protein [Clostridiaceae bacterium]